MQIISAIDEHKEDWNKFVVNHAYGGGLLQTWEWGEFQKSFDHQVSRSILMDDDGDFLATVLAVKLELPFEYNYLYCPRGPIVSKETFNDLTPLFDHLKEEARQNKSFMIRLDPAWVVGNEKRLEEMGFRKSEKEIQPKCNQVIDITKNEEDILAGMKPKTRYNINLAERKGVKVRMSEEPSDMEHFWQLTKQTAKRDAFTSHSKEYYLKMFEVLGGAGLLKLFLAEYENKIIASALVSFVGGYATYLHGASANLYRSVMAPHAMHWHIVKQAKRQGISYYDMGGVNGESYFNKKWQGITTFKNGFNPTVAPVEYIGTFELISNPVVFAGYKFVKQIRG